MATHADISGNLTINALQSVRRNAANTSFEAYTPALSSMGVVETVASIHIAGRNSDISATPITDVPGLYQVTTLSFTDKNAAGAGSVDTRLRWTSWPGVGATSLGSACDLTVLGETGLLNVYLIYLHTGSITYEATITGSYSTASFTFVISLTRLIAFGRMIGTAAGVATQRGTLTG